MNPVVVVSTLVQRRRRSEPPELFCVLSDPLSARHPRTLQKWITTVSCTLPSAEAWRARVAVAGKLAVILHRIWADGSEFRWGKQAAVSLTA